MDDLQREKIMVDAKDTDWKMPIAGFCCEVQDNIYDMLRELQRTKDRCPDMDCEELLLCIKEKLQDVLCYTDDLDDELRRS